MDPRAFHDIVYRATVVTRDAHTDRRDDRYTQRFLKEILRGDHKSKYTVTHCYSIPTHAAFRVDGPSAKDSFIAELRFSCADDEKDFRIRWTGSKTSLKVGIKFGQVMRSERRNPSEKTLTPNFDKTTFVGWFRNRALRVDFWRSFPDIPQSHIEYVENTDEDVIIIPSNLRSPEFLMGHSLTTEFKYGKRYYLPITIADTAEDALSHQITDSLKHIGRPVEFKTESTEGLLYALGWSEGSKDVVYMSPEHKLDVAPNVATSLKDLHDEASDHFDAKDVTFEGRVWRYVGDSVPYGYEKANYPKLEEHLRKYNFLMGDRIRVSHDYSARKVTAKSAIKIDERVYVPMTGLEIAQSEHWIELPGENGTKTVVRTVTFKDRYQKIMYSDLNDDVQLPPLPGPGNDERMPFRLGPRRSFWDMIWSKPGNGCLYAPFGLKRCENGNSQSTTVRDAAWPLVELTGPVGKQCPERICAPKGNVDAWSLTTPYAEYDLVKNEKNETNIEYCAVDDAFVVRRNLPVEDVVSFHRFIYKCVNDVQRVHEGPLPNSKRKTMISKEMGRALGRLHAQNVRCTLTLDNVIVRYRTKQSFDILFTGLEDCKSSADIKFEFYTEWIDKKVVKAAFEKQKTKVYIPKPVLTLGNGYFEVGSRWPHTEDGSTSPSPSLAEAVKRYQLGTILKQENDGSFVSVSPESYLAQSVPDLSRADGESTQVNLMTLLYKRCYGTILLIGCNHAEPDTDPILGYIQKMKVIGLEEYYDAMRNTPTFTSTTKDHAELYSSFDTTPTQNFDVSEAFPRSDHVFKQISDSVLGHLNSLGESVLEKLGESLGTAIQRAIDGIIDALNKTTDKDFVIVRDAILKYRKRKTTFVEEDVQEFLSFLNDKISLSVNPSKVLEIVKSELGKFSTMFEVVLKKENLLDEYFNFQKRRERLKQSYEDMNMVNSEVLDMNEAVVSKEDKAEIVVPKTSGVINAFRRTCETPANAHFVSIRKVRFDERGDDAVLDTVHDVLFDLTAQHSLLARLHWKTILVIEKLSEISPDMYLTLKHKVSKKLISRARRRFPKSVGQAVRFYTCNVHLLAKLFTDLVVGRHDDSPTVVLTSHEDASVLRHILTTVTTFRPKDLHHRKDGDSKIQLPTIDNLKKWMLSMDVPQPPPLSSVATIHPPPLETLSAVS